MRQINDDSFQSAALKFVVRDGEGKHVIVAEGGDPTRYSESRRYETG